MRWSQKFYILLFLMRHLLYLVRHLKYYRIYPEHLEILATRD